MYPIIQLVLSLGMSVALQTSGTVRVDVLSGGRPLPGARVACEAVAATTDESGVATLSVGAGRRTLTVTLTGYAPATVAVDVQGQSEQRVTLDLQPLPEVEETVTVSATRTDARIEDLPVRVEVLAREEIEEKMLMTPGDIVMMLNEMGGMRVQATSPSLGAATVRIQGMQGRYTRFLSDGLPLYGQQIGGLGLLQIPPMDLGQVEVIKGVASALYGAGAMGGVVDLISRRPGNEREHEVLVNRSTRGATDTIAWVSSPLRGRWSGTLLAGGHWQADEDVDGDGWADLAEYARAVVRPRLFWDNRRGRSLFVTAGGTWEDRNGGTVDGATVPASGETFREALETRRFDAGAVGQTVVANEYVIAARTAVAVQQHNHRFGEVLERDRHTTSFGEIAVRGSARRHTWVAGAAVEYDRFSPRDLPRFAYSYTVPGIFLQDDVAVAQWLGVSASARLDWHNELGTFFSPRVSMLLRNPRWSTRISAGTGFFAPTPLTEETEAAGLARLVIPVPLRAERGRSASIDLTRRLGAGSTTVTLFASTIRNPVHTTRDGRFELINLAAATRNVGFEWLTVVRRAPFVATASYTYVRSRELAPEGIRVEAALTPRHSAGLVAMMESEARGRLGVEVYYTGSQRLEENPFRRRSAPYVIVGFLAERRLGRVRLFVNAENLTDVRQTRWDPLLRPARGADGRWTVDAWAPLDGRTLNGGVRIRF